MSHSVTLPLWLAILVGLLAAWAALDRLLLPSVRWFFRRRVNRVLEEMSSRLQIRIQPFKLTKRRVLIDRLRFDPKVLEKAEEVAETEGVPREVVHQRVRRYAREIVPSFNAYLYFRVGYWLSKRLAQSLYRVRLAFSDDEGLRGVDPDSTVVFIMNHRSNMDYVLVSYLAMQRAALSYAVGEWAKVWPLQSLIRSMGAYFVRRGSGNDLYRKVLERYIHMATRGGVTQAIYPEGGLSRNGVLGLPKLGVFDYMLRGFDPSEDRDITFIAVGINYDRTLEDRTLLLDAVPEEERPAAGGVLQTTLAFLWRNFRLWVRNEWHRFGYALVNVGTPLSAKEFLASREVEAVHKLEKSERFVHVQALADEIMRRVGRVVPVTPVSLVATALLESGQEGLSDLGLKAVVYELMQKLRATGCPIYLPREDQDYTLDVGLRMLVLRHLVEEKEGLLRPSPENLDILRYYANSIGHWVGAGREEAA